MGGCLAGWLAGVGSAGGGGSCLRAGPLWGNASLLCSRLCARRSDLCFPALRRLVAPAAVTAMATSHSRWAVVMSRNAGFVDQVRPAVLLAAA